MKAEEQARADIVEVGRRLWTRGFVASNDGNISVRLDDNRLITTPRQNVRDGLANDLLSFANLRLPIITTNVNSSPVPRI